MQSSSISYTFLLNPSRDPNLIRLHNLNHPSRNTSVSLLNLFFSPTSTPKNSYALSSSLGRRRSISTTRPQPKNKALVHCVNSSNTYCAAGVDTRTTLRGWAESLGETLSIAFPIWISLGCLLGLAKPSAFDWVQPRWMMLGMTLNMLGMGMTLTLDDLRGAFSMTRELLTGFVLQYSIMPLSGYLVSRFLQLPSYYAAGLILVGCCPGGLASNIVTYIARGNVALSVLMTAASTILAVVMTPFLTATLAGHYVAVNAVGLIISTLQVVLLPVLAGAILNQYFPRLVKSISPFTPPISVATVAVMNGNAIAQNSSAILSSGRHVILASCLLHFSGFALGYLLSRVLRLDESSSRTVSIEVGMQNTSLGVVLAVQHLGSPMAAVPCAISGISQSVFGSALAGVWRSSLPKNSLDEYSNRLKSEI